MTDAPPISITTSSGTVLDQVQDEIARLSKIKQGILSEKLGWAAIVALILAVGLNIWGLIAYTTSYFLIWISSSLYFYLFYPLLPLLLFPFRYFLQSRGGPKETHDKESIVTWAKNIQVFRNKKVGLRLFLRFFILSLLPMTVGMLCIYSLSILYSVYLGITGIIPFETSRLVFIQGLGIILFYVEIFFFRNYIFKFALYFKDQKGKRNKSLLFFAILAVVLVVVGTIIVILLLVAILLPGYTMNNFVDVSEFVKVRTHLWVFLLLVSQVIIMQFLQHVLSLKIGRDMCDSLLQRLHIAEKELQSASNQGADKAPPMKEHLVLLKETALYAISRRQMFKLFPTYSVGLNLPSLLKLNNLSELNEVFSDTEEL